MIWALHKFSKTQDNILGSLFNVHYLNWFFKCRDSVMVISKRFCKTKAVNFFFITSMEQTKQSIQGKGILFCGQVENYSILGPIAKLKYG